MVTGTATTTARAVDAVVVGGGITGLVAARTLAAGGARVVVVEPDRLGGKVRRAPFDGGLLDEAADAFLARVPEGVALCRELGLDGDLVSPASRRAWIWSHGALRPLPQGQVLGVPTDLDELAATGLVSEAGLAAARRDLEVPLVAPDGDPAIGAFLRTRLGDEVVDRLVDPLVGGINAGSVDALSLAATVPQLDAAARSGAASLVEACRAQRAAVADPEAPVFFAPRGGMGALSEALAADVAARGVTTVATEAAGLERDGTRWRLACADGSTMAADAVVLATPADRAALLLAGVAGAEAAAAFLGGVPYASVAMVALAVDRDAVDRELDGTGYLIPRVEGRTVTGCSWASSKWPHLHGDGTIWLRASVGRHGADGAVDLDDAALVEVVRRDLADTMALRGAPREVRVTRWRRSFPQYRPGHLDGVAATDRALAAVSPRLAVAGAALRGLGVPACIRQGTEAARRLLAAADEPS